MFVCDFRKWLFVIDSDILNQAANYHPLYITAQTHFHMEISSMFWKIVPCWFYVGKLSLIGKIVPILVKNFRKFFLAQNFAESSKNIYFDKWVFSHMFIHAVGITWYSIIICGKKSHDRISFVLIQAHLYVQNLIIDQPHFKSLV